MIRKKKMYKFIVGKERIKKKKKNREKEFTAIYLF